MSEPDATKEMLYFAFDARRALWSNLTHKYLHDLIFEGFGNISAQAELTRSRARFILRSHPNGNPRRLPEQKTECKDNISYHVSMRGMLQVTREPSPKGESSYGLLQLKNIPKYIHPELQPWKCKLRYSFEEDGGQLHCPFSDGLGQVR